MHRKSVLAHRTLNTDENKIGQRDDGRELCQWSHTKQSSRRNDIDMVFRDCIFTQNDCGIRGAIKSVLDTAGHCKEAD